MHRKQKDLRGGLKSLQKAEAAIHGLFNGPCLVGLPMANYKSFLATLLIASLLSSPTLAQRSREQDAAYRDTQKGGVLPLRNIENNILPSMKARGADYIGAEYDGQLSRYRLKFMRGSSVIWIDVDGRNGRVIGRTGE
jgi:hypothetical protein